MTSCSQCNITLGFCGFQQLCQSISESRSLFYKAALYPKAQKNECIPTKGGGGVSWFAQQNIRFQNNHYLFLKSIILLHGRYFTKNLQRSIDYSVCTRQFALLIKWVPTAEKSAHWDWSVVLTKKNVNKTISILDIGSIDCYVTEVCNIILVESGLRHYHYSNCN